MAPAVIETLRLTLTFLASHARTLLRLIWFPVLILALSDVFFTAKLLPFLPAIQSGNVAEIQNSLLPSLGFIALGLLVPLVMSATAATAVLRFVVLGEGKDSRSLLHVATGAPVVRVAGVTIVLSVILILVAFLIAFIVLTIGTALPALGALMPMFIFIGLSAIGSRWLLAYPSAAIGGRIDLQGAWVLTKPVYSRIVALVVVAVGFIGLVAIVSGLAESALISAYGPDPASIAKGFKERWPFITLVSFLSNLFATASFFTLLGVVYRLRMAETETGRPALHPVSQPDEPAP